MMAAPTRCTPNRTGHPDGNIARRTCPAAHLCSVSTGCVQVGETDLVGSVVGCDCIVVDDMIDTAVTLVAAANELVAFGACRVFAFATHGLFNGPAVADIEASPIEEVVVTNTIPLPANVNAGTRKVRQVSVGKLLAQAIKCIHTGDSVKSLFEWSQGASLLA